MQVFQCEVPAECEGDRLDRFLASRSFLPTRSRTAALVRGGHVRVDGVLRKASFKVYPGARIDIQIPPEEPSEVEAEAIPLSVLHEDEALIVINKPPQMASHPAPGSRRGTLVAALLYRWQFEGSWPDPQRPGIVHRLDKDTTGVIAVAKTPQALHALARQFAARQVEKRYLAVALGTPRTTRMEVDLPIGRDPFDRKRMQARLDQQRPASTRFEVLRVLGSCGGATLIQAEPLTGRTHQIRVHLASLGHPIVGDQLYGGGHARPGTGGVARQAIEAFPRQALHASRLSFRHPLDGRQVEFEAPMPSDMADLIAAIGRPPDCG